MRWIRRLLAALTLLAVLLFGLLFAVQNNLRIPLDLVVVALPEQPASLWFALVFLCGGLFGMAIASLAVLRLRVRQRSLQRRLSHCEAELSRQGGGVPKH